MTMLTFHTSLSEIANRYDCFIIDVWGVILSADRLYPGALACLQALRAKGKQILIMSNVPSRATYIGEYLAKLGIDATLYDHILTSGEVCYQEFAAKATQKERYYEIFSRYDHDLFLDLPYQRVTNIAEADFILGLGIDDATVVPQYRAALQHAAARQLPFLCVNPDFYSPNEGGEIEVCIGILAKEYETLGGPVRYYGKPYPRIYEEALSLAIPRTLELFQDDQKKASGGHHATALLGACGSEDPGSRRSGRLKEEGGKKRILAIGDTFHTDIVGANQAGISTALITGGILAHRLGPAHAEPETAFPLLAEYCEEFQQSPHYVLPYLTW